MMQHMWVSMQYSPLIVEESGSDLNIYVDDVAAEAAEDQAMMGCWFCHTPLTVESYHTECEHEQTSPN